MELLSSATPYHKGSHGMTVGLDQQEKDCGDELFVEDIVIKPVGIRIREVKVLAKLEGN
jgi:hypothetical protein